MRKSPLAIASLASLVSLAVACGSDSLVDTSAEEPVALHAADALPTAFKPTDLLTVRSVADGSYLEARDFGYLNWTEITTGTEGNKFSQHWWITRKASGRYRFLNGNAGRCLNMGYASTANGAKAILYDCTDTANNEELHAVQVGTGVYELRFGHSGKCLEAGSAVGRVVTQSDCRGDSRQRWTFGFAPLSEIRVSTGYSTGTRCLSVNGDTASAPLEQAECKTVPEQQFWVGKVANGSYYFRARHTNQCLDVAGVGVDNGTGLQEYPCVWQANQQFWPTRVAGTGTDSLYTLSPGHVTKCLEREGVRNATSGAKIQLWSCTGATNQQFKIPGAVL